MDLRVLAPIDLATRPQGIEVPWRELVIYR
jgi:hypothetical protein